MRCFFLFFWPIRLSIIVIFFVVCFESVNFVSFFVCTCQRLSCSACTDYLYVTKKKSDYLWEILFIYYLSDYSFC